MGAAALPMALMAASTMFDAFTSSNQSKGEARALEENARRTELGAAFDREDIRRRGRAVQGEAIAASADLAGTIEGGSTRDLLFQNALETEYAAMTATYQGAVEASGLRGQAALKKQEAKAAIFGGILRAGAAAVTGITSARNEAAIGAARDQRTNAYFPGGQRLPMPPRPSYSTPPIVAYPGGG